MRLSLDVSSSKELDEQIIRLVIGHVDTALRSDEVKHAIDDVIAAHVKARYADMIKNLVLDQIRRQVEQQLGRAMKEHTIENTIRSIVSDLFKARFGSNPE